MMFGTIVGIVGIAVTMISIVVTVVSIIQNEKKDKRQTSNRSMNRPPKVRPKNLTIGRSVFLWQNTAMNLRKKWSWNT